MSEHGPESANGLWKYAGRLNDEYAKKVGRAIVKYADDMGADVIVFEHLDFRWEKRRGSMGQKL